MPESTPTQSDCIDRLCRVLVVYGSESGNAKRGIMRWISKWKARGDLQFEITDILSGNELVAQCGGQGTAQAKNLEWVAQRCDVLLVATSSYGDGDPPSNMRDMTGFLMHEASMNSDALTGVQHAVLGFGSSTYTTFQNVPRLTDKFLGECGSRRLAMRAEIDEHDPNPGEEAAYLKWGEDVFAALQKLPPVRSPPVCEWTQPADKIAMPAADEDLVEHHPFIIPTICECRASHLTRTPCALDLPAADDCHCAVLHACAPTQISRLPSALWPSSRATTGW